MIGAATALHEALWGLMENTDTNSSTLPGEVRGITPEQLAVMDAAADLSAKAKYLRLDLSQVGIETPDTGHVSLTCGLLTRLAEEELCLRLLERAVQRRKEGGA